MTDSLSPSAAGALGLSAALLSTTGLESEVVVARRVKLRGSAGSKSALPSNRPLRPFLLSAGAAKWVMRVFIFYPSVHGNHSLRLSLVAPAAAVRVDVRRRWLLAAPAGIFRCARCRLAAASSNYSPILGIAPCLSRLFCHAPKEKIAARPKGV